MVIYWADRDEEALYGDDPYEDVMKFEKMKGKKRGNEGSGSKSRRANDYKQARREAERAKDEIRPDPE